MTGPLAPALSALVVIHNEETRLQACLEKLTFADEIVIVLDRCTDGSKEIAARFTDRLIEGAWPNEGDRRNNGILECAGPWILEVDADEHVPAALAAEIRDVIASSGADRHQILVDNYIGPRLVRYGWGASFGRSAYDGLFRKGAKEWGRQRVHPKLRFAGTVGARLATPIQHYLAEDISGLTRRLDSYASARALDLNESGQIGSYWRNVGRILPRFYKCFFRRRGYREGRYGLIIALCAARYPLLSYLKARRLTDGGAG